MAEQNRKKIILCLRWTAIVVTSYLILFGQGRVTDISEVHLFILVYLISNVVLTFLPSRIFSRPRTSYGIVLMDVFFVSAGMYFSEKVTSDFYIVFFLIVILASVSRNYKLLVVIAGVISCLYGLLLYSWGFLSGDDPVSYTLRIPFVFIMALFYGYIVQTFTREKEEELAVSETRYRGLFESANEGILILKCPEMEISEANREAERLLGSESGTLRGRPMASLLSPKDMEEGVRWLEEVLVGGDGRRESLSLIRRQGGSFEVDLAVSRVDLGTVPSLQVIFRDLSEQRRLERRILEAKRNLEAIFDGIRDRLSIQDTDYRILRVNRAVTQSFGTTYGDLIGKKCFEVYYERTEPCPNCPVSRTLQTGQPASSVRKNPRDERIEKASSFPILDEKGALVSVIECVEDITEERRFAEQLIQSEKLAGLGRVAAGVAHEINNPLAGIVGMAEIAMEEEDLAATRDHLADILRCGKRIREIVDSLKSYSKTSGKADCSDVDLNEAINDALKMVRFSMKKKINGVRIVKELGLLEPYKASPGEIQLMLTHLLNNALQSMDDRDGTLTIVTRPMEGNAEIQVRDTGRGMSVEVRDHMFEPFFSTRSPEGKGLGLNIVYRIVNKYGGKIELDSREDEGTTFTIRLPMEKEGPWTEKYS